MKLDNKLKKVILFSIKDRNNSCEEVMKKLFEENYKFDNVEFSEFEKVFKECVNLLKNGKYINIIEINEDNRDYYLSDTGEKITYGELYHDEVIEITEKGIEFLKSLE